MLRHLTTAQEELRQANANLDGKVDELAQANMRLYEMNTLKSDFLATMSHELRTPLNSILGFSEVLGSIDALDEKQKRYVQNIQKSGKTLLEMINDILDLAKIESGKMETRLTDFRIAQVVARPVRHGPAADGAEEHRPGKPRRRRTCRRCTRTRPACSRSSTTCSPTPSSSRPRAAASRSPSAATSRTSWCSQVIDTGVGIAEEDQQAIFEKFRQGRTAMPSGDAMTREYSGSGLGLSIVKELCRLLGGEVSLQSELGKGSTFTVRLPWVLAGPAAARLRPWSTDFEEFTKQRFEVGRRSRRPAARRSFAHLSNR